MATNKWLVSGVVERGHMREDTCQELVESQ